MTDDQRRYTELRDKFNDLTQPMSDEEITEFLNLETPERMIIYDASAFNEEIERHRES